MKTKASIIRVSSGGLTRNVKASDPEAAFKIFLARYKPKALGQLVEFKSTIIDDPEHIAYASTERLLKAMGRWSDD